MQDKNRNVTIDAVYKRFDETGRIKTMNTETDTDIQPHIYWGSDVFKWIEGASYVIAKHPDKNLEKYFKDLARDISGKLGAKVTIKNGKNKGKRITHPPFFH